jgi:hypothetical protein
MERVMLEMERFMAGSEFDDIEQANEAIRRRFSGPMDAIPSTGSTPLEKAQEMAYRAFEARAGAGSSWSGRRSNSPATARTPM